mmetsp:Transcript_70164/g.123718  ORF Transcript_70164/g.123718 Transcript_70164/m.123718 type:complete len:206 (+) Transcript_70164:599-1216(+)
MLSLPPSRAFSSRRRLRSSTDFEACSSSMQSSNTLCSSPVERRHPAETNASFRTYSSISSTGFQGHCIMLEQPTVPRVSFSRQAWASGWLSVARGSSRSQICCSSADSGMSLWQALAISQTSSNLRVMKRMTRRYRADARVGMNSVALEMWTGYKWCLPSAMFSTQRGLPCSSTISVGKWAVPGRFFPRNSSSGREGIVAAETKM